MAEDLKKATEKDLAHYKKIIHVEPNTWPPTKAQGNDRQLPDASVDDYCEMPVEMFGQAYLSAYGWDGMGTGIGSRRGIAHSVEHKGNRGSLGLGYQVLDAANIKVVVRKRPMNKKEITRKEVDAITIADNTCLTVHVPMLKVDLTAYVEKHNFHVDAVLDAHVPDEEVYRVTVQPLIPIIFQGTNATCYAYGQTGSGKTHTVLALPLRAAEDILSRLHKSPHRDLKLFLSFLSVYGRKLLDLLNDRKEIRVKKDGTHASIVGLREIEVSDWQIVKKYIKRGDAARKESSTAHAILQLTVKEHNEVKETRQDNDGNSPSGGLVIGKIYFADLAGSERATDTSANDRPTREIIKSLLALQECLCALDNDKNQVPFCRSTLTEVLCDSFVGKSKCVMISCISPTAGYSEQTLSTLRYASSLCRAKGTKKDQSGTRSEFDDHELKGAEETQPESIKDKHRANEDQRRRSGHTVGSFLPFL